MMKTMKSSKFNHSIVLAVKSVISFHPTTNITRFLKLLKGNRTEILKKTCCSLKAIASQKLRQSVGQICSPQNCRRIPGIQGNYFIFQELSRALEENYEIPGVIQGPGRTLRNSRSYPGPWKKITKLQELSRAMEENNKIPGILQEIQELCEQ